MQCSFLRNLPVYFAHSVLVLCQDILLLYHIFQSRTTKFQHIKDSEEKDFTCLSLCNSNMYKNNNCLETKPIRAKQVFTDITLQPFRSVNQTYQWGKLNTYTYKSFSMQKKKNTKKLWCLCGNGFAHITEKAAPNVSLGCRRDGVETLAD